MGEPVSHIALDTWLTNPGRVALKEAREFFPDWFPNVEYTAPQMDAAYIQPKWRKAFNGSELGENLGSDKQNPADRLLDWINQDDARRKAEKDTHQALEAARSLISRRARIHEFIPRFYYTEGVSYPPGTIARAYAKSFHIKTRYWNYRKRERVMKRIQERLTEYGLPADA
jgi:hypothetical protein